MARLWTRVAAAAALACAQWMKDQYLDILFRWLYLPLYILFASFSLNF